MNLKKLFGTAETLTAEERKKLEALDASCSELKTWLDDLPRRMPTSREDRRQRVASAAGDFVQNATSASFEKLMNTTRQQAEEATIDFEMVANAIRDAVKEKMAPQNEIIQGALKRHLGKLEKQYQNFLAREQKESTEFGIEFKPSGIIRGLEQKILELRNRIHNGNHGYWREALAELL